MPNSYHISFFNKILLFWFLMFFLPAEISAQQVYVKHYRGDNGRWGLLDEKNNKITEPKYDFVDSYFFKGVTQVSVEGKIGFVNQKGKEITPIVYDKSGLSISFLHGFQTVMRSGKWGVINTLGKEVVKLQYELLIQSYPGLFKAKMDGKWG